MREEDSVVYGHFKTCNADEHNESDFFEKLTNLKDELVVLGFETEEDADVRIEPWLVSRGISPPDYSVNLAKLDIDPDANYAALVEPLFTDKSYLLVFKIRPDFSLGEEWRFVLEVLLIGRKKPYGLHEPIFDEFDQDKSGLTLIISPGFDQFTIELENGLSAELLSADIQAPIYGLADFLAVRALSNSKAKLQ